MVLLAEAPYAKEIKYLSDEVAKNGSVSKENRIYKMLDSKRNVKSVQEFLSSKVDPKLTA